MCSWLAWSVSDRKMPLLERHDVSNCSEAALAGDGSPNSTPRKRGNNSTGHPSNSIDVKVSD